MPFATNGEPNLTISQRALIAARQIRQFSPDAMNRQSAGTRAPDCAKGKSAAKAAAGFNVAPRTVEQAQRVLRRGVPELVQGVDNGRISISSAVKAATLPADAQRQFVADIAAGRPVEEALAVAGVQERDPPNFDDKTLSHAMTNLRKLLDLRASAYGPNDAYRNARDHLHLSSRALSRWRTERLNEPMPVFTDARGQQVPVKVVPAFQTAEEIKILCERIDALIKSVEGLAGRPGSDWIHTNIVKPALMNAYKDLCDAQATHLCPRCRGNPPCSNCRGLGWLTVAGWRIGQA